MKNGVLTFTAISMANSSVDQDVQALRTVFRQPAGQPLEHPVHRSGLPEPGPHTVPPGP
ncbi:hypothetical protein [Streptomyces lavendulae]|uniref:hypothetical protein n=1 Tax=Streptomyces lavendulae TaxID=1914 RepID=UPI0036EE8B60